MELKKSSKKVDTGQKTPAPFKGKKILLVLFILIFSASLLLFTGISGIYFGTKLKASSYVSVFSSLYRYFRPSFNTASHYIKGVLSNPETIHINIKHLDYQKLAYHVSNARKRGLITEEDKSEEVKATIDHRGINYKVRMRLRGTYLDHIRGDKWSFRIKVRGDNTLLGMARFSLSSPEIRSHIHEWVFQQALKNEGLLNIRYKFVQVVLNGKKLGIYALEEFFDKRLIENNELREGIIVKPALDEPKIYQKKKLQKKPALGESYALLLELIKAFKSKQISANQLFDIEKTAKYFALAELFGGQHGHEPINFICYFNPITALLEPIGYDSNVSRKLERYNGMITSPKAAYNIYRDDLKFIATLFDDEVFYRAYVKELIRVTDTRYVEDLFEKIQPELDHNLSILYKEYPYLDYFKRDYLNTNIDYINNQLHKNGLLKINILKTDDTNQKNILIDNLRDLSIQILGIQIDQQLTYRPKLKALISPTVSSSPVLVRLYLDPEHENKNPINHVGIVYKVIGTDKIHRKLIDNKENLINLNMSVSNIILKSKLLSKESNIEKFKFLDIDHTNYIISVLPGNWDIDKDLVVPADYELIIREGVQLNLTDSANILSYSPVRFLGRPDLPIRIISKDKSGQGFILIKAGKKSIIKHTIFENLSALNKQGWSLTGAVTIYQSDVHIENARCVGNISSDDCLNIVRSKFQIKNASFENTYADALDVDFGEGTISSTTFKNIGNDAVDGSGSKIKISNLSLNKVKDKGFSCGEESDFHISDTEISNTNTALASKDNSFLFAENLNISNSEVGFAAYQKKAEFGPAHIEIKNTNLNKVKHEHVIEKGSSLKIDQDSILNHNTNLNLLNQIR